MKVQLYKNAPSKIFSTHYANWIHRMSKLEFKLVNKSNYQQLNCQWVEKNSDDLLLYTGFSRDFFAKYSKIQYHVRLVKAQRQKNKNAPPK